jgi:tetratricopeptide (TPR) repeat protein
MGLVDAGLGIIKGIPEGATGNPLEVARMEALAYFKKNDFARAELLLTAARAKSPKDADFCGVTAQFYRIMGYAALSKSNGDAVKDKDAAGWFQKALAALDEELKLLNAPMEVMAHVQEISAVNLKRTEMQMMLTNYPDAIATSTAMLQQDPENPVPLLNRAISELQLGRVDAAKNDYQALEKKVPEPSHRVYFGLAQIAQKQNDKPAEIRYDKLYLQYAPTNTAEYTNVTRQLHQLEGR